MATSLHLIGGFMKLKDLQRPFINSRQNLLYRCLNQQTLDESVAEIPQPALTISELMFFTTAP